MNPDFSVVAEFEKKIAEFFGAPYAVAVDSCTHGLELCLRYQNVTFFRCPKRTYLSVPMLAYKLGVKLYWEDVEWKDYYDMHATQLGGFSFSGYHNPVTTIYDAAVYWKQNGYIKDSFMCLSFQYQKHLSLGRGGMILCPDEASYNQLKKMSYDGRLPGMPWRDQDIDTIGYHYYMTPETAIKGLTVLDEAIRRTPRQWTINDWPDISKMKVFQ